MKPAKAKTGVFFLIIVILSVPYTSTACTDQERQALLSFLGNLSTPLQSWTATIEPDCCKWEGITCNPSSSITEISLPTKGLNGEISPVLSNLTNLSYLNLSSNYLSGQLPVELLSLSTSIKVLDLSFNKLSGEIPGFANPVIQVLNVSNNYFTGFLPIILATSLESLDIANNSLTGPIPNYLCTHLPFLTSLAISNNKFSGKISSGLANCTTLRDFNAGYNNLTGSLPDELFELTSLEYLTLCNNRIYGSLNGVLLARLQNLVSLDLSTNFLTGSIPESIGQLNKLSYLQLNNNNLTGDLPSSIENCTDLRQLNIRENKLTGDLQHINFTKLSSLELLDLLVDEFTGEIPERIYTCKNLTALRFLYTNLNGQISPAIENLSALSYLAFSLSSATNITGTLQIISKCKNLTALFIKTSFIGEAIPIEPTWANGFENMQGFALTDSNLTGPIPSWISKMNKLEFLKISGNRFTGKIPDWLSSLTSLIYLDLSDNLLSGNIPLSLTQLPLMNSVRDVKQVDPGYLQLPIYQNSTRQYKKLTAIPTRMKIINNQLSGTIPEEIGQLTTLHSLELSGNRLSGPIPDSIGNLTDIEGLDLSRNYLTGPVPPSLTRLHFLSRFSVAYNNLSGPIPTGGQLDTFSSSSYEGNLNLCGAVAMRECSESSNGENKAPPIKRKYDEGTVIAVILGFFFGVVLVETMRRLKPRIKDMNRMRKVGFRQSDR